MSTQELQNVVIHVLCEIAMTGHIKSDCEAQTLGVVSNLALVACEEAAIFSFFFIKSLQEAV